MGGASTRREHPITIKTLSLAGGLLLLSGVAAFAAPALVSQDLNLRSGPGTGYGVVNVLPAGSTVDAYDCGDYWCRVASREGVGYASSGYLNFAGATYATAGRGRARLCL
jgi:uncharacterized protein YraI